jgi:hypothetical protein
MAKDDGNTSGRRANAAQPLGERDGLISQKQTKAAARKEQSVASADNVTARTLGETFKKRPSERR